MSQTITLLKQIENLNANELAEALEFNGYAECVGAIRSKNIDGQEFLRLTELNISLWRLPTVHARRLWSFIQQIREDPKQFLMNIEKPAPKVNKSKFASEKPPTTISNSFQKSVQLTERNEMIQTENTETSFSTLSKQKSKELKNKLELVFRKEPIEAPNLSFVYSQRQPQVPPRPDNLKLGNTEELKQSEQTKDEEDDFNDGYLSPINKRKRDKITKENEKRSSANIVRSNSNSSTSNLFLNKFRKGYENLEVRPQVIENKYEEQTVKPPRPAPQERPLPPIPKGVDNTKPLVPNLDHTTDDEELPHYVPIIENEVPKSTSKGKINTVTRKESFNRPLPEITFKGSKEFLNSTQVLINNSNITTDDEELAEYTPVLEDEEGTIPTVPVTKNYNYHRPLPPVPVPFLPTVKINERPSISIPTEDLNLTESSKAPALVTPHPSGVKLKPRAELPKSPNPLPKSSNTLPKPPINLPRPPLEIVPPDLLLPTQSDFPPSADETCMQPRHSPIPPNVHSEQNLNMPEEIEESFYTEIDLATLPSYREIDRKGARRLLSGLDDGTFLIRPSTKNEYVCTLSIMTAVKMYNLGVEKKSDGTFAFSAAEENFQQPKVYSIGELIAYYSKTPIYLSGEYVKLKDILSQSRQ